MKLKLKEEYYEYSIGGGKVKMTKLKDIPSERYPEIYNSGWSYMFDIEKPKVEKIEKKDTIANDTNTKRSDEGGISNT